MPPLLASLECVTDCVQIILLPVSSQAVALQTSHLSHLTVIMTNGTNLLVLLTLTALTLAEVREVRKMGRAKHMFWFKVTENDEGACDEVKEAEVKTEIVEGPPASGCTADQERFCMCGKIGPLERRRWTYFCGR